MLAKAVNEWAAKVDPHTPQFEFIAAVAINMPRFYDGVEDILNGIVQVFDQFQPAGPDWHRQLLTLSMDNGIFRPPIIRRKTFEALNSLRGFRHIVSKIYTKPLDWHQMRELATGSLQTLELIKTDLTEFQAVIQDILRRQNPANHN